MTSPGKSLRNETLALARQLGFDLCRFAPATAPEHANQFRTWLAKGAAGEMAYLKANSEKRCSPELVLRDAKTVLVLGLNYYRGSRPAGAARIARYAWGDDYHELIKKRLAVLDRFLTEHGGNQKCYVDTGPVLERDHAAKAGLGWQGKSTMLVNRTMGTWFFIATILTTLQFSADVPEPDRCGTCTRCINACPTGAISEAYQLDARRCISYLTIELKGPIPIELRPLIGDRIYGCDDCLEACPWNRFAKVSHESAFAMHPEVAAMHLRDYLKLDEPRFRTLFRSSPIKRTKRRGLLRNVCVALGNVGTVDDLPALNAAASDEEPLIAEHARWAIEQILRREGANS